MFDGMKETSANPGIPNLMWIFVVVITLKIIYYKFKES
jgi:hypothetical protein